MGTLATAGTREFQDVQNLGNCSMSVMNTSEKNVTVASCAVDTKMRVVQIEESPKLDKFRWIKETLSDNIQMLYSASNGIVTNDQTMVKYVSTWVCAESITYVSVRDSDTFELAMSFPKCIGSLMRLLHKHKNMEKVNS